MTMLSLNAAAIAIFALLPLDGSTGASAPKNASALIQDRAEFFSPEAEAAALRAIDQLRRENVDVRVETFESVPAGKGSNVAELSARERAEFFAGWLKELAQERQAKGVLILICKEPSHLRVGISKDLYRRGFNDEVRDGISERLLRGFRARDYDRGLLEAVAYIASTADRVAAPGAAAAPTSQRTGRRDAPRAQEGVGFGLGGLLCVGLVLFLGFMVVRSLLRMFQRPQAAAYGGYGQPVPGQPGYGQQPGQYGGGYGGLGGGGGMFGGLMSGIGGALLGNYLYDRWNTPGGQAGHSPMDQGAGPMHDDSSRYQDFTSSGGDFGDSGGGDFGGGDWGGGDGGDGGGDF